MALFDIKAVGGASTRYSGKLRYNGTFGGVSYVEFQQISSPTLIDFHVGDYVDYSRTGFRYKLYSLPRPTKKSGNNTVGDTYIYKNVQLHCATKDLELAPFRDLVLNDNLIHFTTLPTISVYDDVYGIADRIQACMDDFSGTGVWNITVMNTSDPTLLSVLQREQEFSVSGVSCLEALNEIYRLWSGIGWVYSVVNGVNTITLGRPNLQDAGNTTDVFSYGLDNGLRVIAQAISGKNEMATRLYVYGSDRNMPPRYYNNLTPTIYSYESVYIPNLMIPPSHWGTTSSKRDARKAYVEDVAAISEYGLIPKTIYFDGSGDYEEIYPSLEDMTFAELRAALGVGAEYYPSPSRYPNSDYVNTIKAVTNPTDNGVLENAGEKYAESGTDSWEAIDEEFPYVEGQAVLNINPGGTLVTYEATHSGRMKINAPAMFSLDCEDMGEVTANIVVTVNGVATQIVPLEVNRLRMGAYFETKPITQDVEAGDEVGLVVGGEVRLIEGHDGGICYVVADAGTADFNVQYTIGDVFTITLKQIGFDISKQGTPLSNGLATIAMKSGMCGGREFVVKTCKYNELLDQWELQCYRQKDDSLGQYFPNTIYPIEEGDSYVLIDMMMPDVYVTAAEERLYDRALEVLAQMSKPKIVYTPEVDAKVLALAPETVLEGMYMPVYDENLIPTTVDAYPHTTWVLISALQINEDEAEIPTYKVTLQDEKAGSFVQSYTYQMNRNAMRLRLEDIEGSRSAYIPDEEVTGGSAVPFLELEASSDFFTYPAGAVTPVETSIILQAIPHDIPNPSYQWYWLGTQDWEELVGETGQTYEVDPDSSIYYQNGELAEDFLCVVTSGGSTYTARKVIVKITGGENGLTVMLNNPAHVFAAGVTTASMATDTISVIAYRGLTRVATTVGTITGERTGLTTSISDNNTDHTTITISVTTALTWRSGTLTIPVTAEGETINLTYSWALANRGEKGDQGNPGQQGKTQRGPSDYSATTQYYGIEGTGDFIDYVYNANRTKLYVCIKTPPGEGYPLTDRTYWQESTIQDFVATKVFYAALAYVQNLGVNVVKVADAQGNAVGGMMPVNTYENGVNINGNYVFWLGGPTPDSQTTTFKVDKDGNVISTSGTFGPYTLGSNGFTYSVSNSNYSKTVNLTLDDLYLYYAQQGSSGSVRIRPRLGDAMIEVEQSGNLAALNKPGIKISASGSGKAISVPQGVYEGLRPAIKVGTASTTLGDLDHTLIIPESLSVGADVYLPGTPKNGQEYEIINYSSHSAGVGYSGTSTIKVKLLSTPSTTGTNSVILPSRQVMHLVYCTSFGHWLAWIV